PGTYFSVGNEDYTVNQTMNFESITTGSSYIIFNNTGFYVSSGNDITITLVYINDDMTGAGDGEKVLEFYGDTVGGNVWFNLSGFPVDNNYTVDRSGSSIAIPSVNGSGFISFTNDVWSSQLFEIFQGGEANNPPVVSDIPGQTILEGANFTQIDLDNYVTDDEDPDENISWSYSGNTELLVSIVNRVATISTPNSSWNGAETITFTAKDTGGLTDSDVATFKVISHHVPVFSGLSISNGSTQVSVSTSSLSITIEDADGDPIDWTIETSPNIGINSGNNEPNGSKSCSISGLAYSTTYYWFVNATDGTHWTNGSYSFTTESAQPNNPPSSPPLGNDEQEIIPGENNTPETPVKPSGSTFVEIGVEYVYTSSTVDVDGDQIRFRFDWGDGDLSNWSEFVVSNTSVSMPHAWTSISNYEVRVMAQDENGLNSSWSLPLNVSVSQFDFEGEPPVANFVLPSKISTNETIFFDGSASFDEDGVIISYFWDFGDGENGSGISLSHVYKNPGKYTVTLVVTDNNGNTYSKSTIITVVSEVEEEEQKGLLPFNLGTLLIGSALILLFCLTVIFRNNIKSFVSAHYTTLFPHWKIMDTRTRIEKVDAKIEELKKRMVTRTDFKQLPVGMGDAYSDEIQKRYDRIYRLIDSEIATTSEEKESFDEFDKFNAGEKVDRLIRIRQEADKLYAEKSDSGSLKDSRSTIDNLILSYGRKNLNKFDNKESMFYESDGDSIGRKVDNLPLSKIRKKSSIQYGKSWDSE
ncbi:MAG: PKD domain-containing protein, partial [Thermoplasmatales archaeon]